MGREKLEGNQIPIILHIAFHISLDNDIVERMFVDGYKGEFGERLNGRKCIQFHNLFITLPQFLVYSIQYNS